VSIAAAATAVAAGVEHLLRNVKDATISTLASDVSAKLQALKGLKTRLSDVQVRTRALRIHTLVFLLAFTLCLNTNTLTVLGGCCRQQQLRADKQLARSVVVSGALADACWPVYLCLHTHRSTLVQCWRGGYPSTMTS
jgi:hypothetical protein